MKRIFSLLFALSLVASAYGQQTKNNPALLEIAEPAHREGWLEFRRELSAKAEPAFFAQHKAAFGLGPKDDMRRFNAETDSRGNVHTKFQQYHDGIPVEGAVFILHSDGERVQTGNGQIIHALKIDNRPVLSPEQAIEAAIKAVPANKYAWEIPSFEAQLKARDPQATYYPSPQLVVFDKKYSRNAAAYALAYKIDVYAIQPHSRYWVYINAATGAVIHKSTRIYHTDVPALANTKYYGIKNITTDSIAPGQYRLQESGRGGGIYTYNLRQGDQIPDATEFTDTDNFWDNINAEQDEVAADAHWGAEMTYDFYLEKFGRNSIDGKGFPLTSYVHWKDPFWGGSNAGWNGTLMVYGDGDGQQYGPFTLLDICGHEITHGLTERTANLIYQGESGALNESFSDIFGITLEYYKSPTTFNWELGEQIFIDYTGNGLRSMDDPKKHNNPDTYQGEYWVDPNSSEDGGGVHTNSGVLNHWFYLLCVGGSGTNDHGLAYNVQPIGIQTSLQVAYAVLTGYLTETSQYADAREASLQLAKDAFGVCSPKYLSVVNAWAAVGLSDFTIADNDIAMDSVVTPESSCGLGAAESISATIVYNGCETQIPAGSTIGFRYQIDNGSIVEEDVVTSQALQLRDKVTHNFTTPADLSALGMHTIKVWADFAADTLGANDTIVREIESKLQQNSDIGAVEVISPKGTACDYTEPVEVSMRFTFYGCDFLPAGIEIQLAYEVIGQSPVYEAYTLQQDFRPGDTLQYTFAQKADISANGVYQIIGLTRYFPDQNLENDASPATKVVNIKGATGNTFATFEHPDAMDSVVVRPGERSIFALNKLGSSWFGELGVHFEGQGPSFDSSFNLLLDPVTTEDDIWKGNEAYSSFLCFCIDAPDIGDYSMSFDLRQHYAGGVDFFGIKTGLSSAVRILVNGEQVSKTFLPSPDQTGFELSEFLWQYVDLFQYAGQTFELCFESKNIFGNYGALENGIFDFTDMTHIDNINIGSYILATDRIPQAVNDLQLSPNPVSERMQVTFGGSLSRSSELTVVNYLGQPVSRQSLEKGLANTSLSVAGLVPGFYVLQVTNAGGVSTKKFMVQ